MLLCILVVNLGRKTRFIFLQKLAYSRPKTLQTSFNVMFSAKKRENLCNNTGIQLKHSVLSEIKTKKPHKNRRKKTLNCADLPIFRQDNYQNATNYVFHNITTKFV